jgi:hypothetical protein
VVYLMMMSIDSLNTFRAIDEPSQRTRIIRNRS